MIFKRIISAVFSLTVFATCIPPVMAKNRQVEVKADELQIQSEKKIASFTGNVRATYDGLRFYCSKMTVAYNENGNIIRLTAVGNVTILKDGAKAVAQRATLNATTHTITLTGHPSLTRDNNTLKGNAIEVDIQTGRIQITQAVGTFIFKQGP